jgi:hypothetical protein
VQNFVMSADVLVFVSVIVAIFVFRADYLQRKREATFQFYEGTDELRNNIEDVFGDDKIDPNDLRYKDNKELQRTIIRLLGIYERISVGINLGVLDKTVFVRFCGRLTIKWYDRLELVIKYLRGTDKPWIYSDFEDFAKDIRKEYARQDGSKE